MTTRNLASLFAPKSIVLVGASNQTGSVGNVVARNLLAGGFEGPVMFVNPHEDTVCGAKNFRSLDELPAQPDLAVLATPSGMAPRLVADLGANGCRAVVVIAAGFDAAQRQMMLDAARPYLMRIIGPNCLGFLSSIRGINASFSHTASLRGRLALLTQSGAIATSIIDWANGHDVGFSHIVSMGDMADVDFGDLLDFLAMDPATSAILLYAETVTSARKFMSAARIAARAKPVIVVKAGRSAAGARAAVSHTGALAGTDALYDAAFRRAGVLRVNTLRDLFDAAETLDTGLKVSGDRLVILTNGGGLGVMAADALEAGGGRLTALSTDTTARLNEVLPSTWSRGNPIDIIGDADGRRYEAALEIVSNDKESDAILVMNCPTGVANSLEAVDAVLRAKGRHQQRAMLACWMGEATAGEARRRLTTSNLPAYQTPEEAVNAFLRLHEYRRLQRTLHETPSRALNTTPTDARTLARQVIDAALSENRQILTEPEAKAVLSAYSIPVVATHIAASPVEAGAIAESIGFPVALKILSRQITHKSDVGGVSLNLDTPQAVCSAAEDMLAKVRRKAPGAAIDGFTVQKMVKRPHAQELLLGAVIDPTFGPNILFGHGGVATEVIADRTLGLPPLNSVLAEDMIARTRVSRLLSGYRDRPPANLEAIVSSLVALSNLVIDVPQITELDINPLLADEAGAIALDARIVVRQAVDDPNRLAIRPWPRELVHDCLVANRPIRVRPVRPDDVDGLIHLTVRTRAQDIQMRFHGAIKPINTTTAARLCQIDYDREMVLLAEQPDASIAGVVRLVFDPEFERAECAIIVRSDLQGQGFGRLLLGRALTYARSRGAKCAWGDVLSENAATVDLARRLGGTCHRPPQDATITRVEFQLT